MVSLKKEKLFELDYMRVMACMAVMVVHISATGVTDYIQGSFPNVIMTLLNRSLKFTTPIFIFLSGVTGFYGYRNKEFKYISFLKKRLPKVLIPYFVWCVVYYYAYMKMGYYGFNPVFFLKSVIAGTMSYHLYFVIIILQLYMLGPIFYNMVKKSKKKILLLFVFAIITAICVEFLRFKLSDRIFLKYMFFYMLGIYASIEHDKFTQFIIKNKNFIIIGYILAALTYTVGYYYNFKIYSFIWFSFSTVSIFFVYLVGLYLKGKLQKNYSKIKLLSQSSYYIYLMHPLILTILIKFSSDNGIISVTKRLAIYFIVVFSVTIGLSITFTVFKNKFKNSINKKAVSAK